MSQTVGTPSASVTLLVLHQRIDALAVERRARQHQLGARHRARIGHAPRVDVEHRHHEQHRLAPTRAPGRRPCTPRTNAALSSDGSRARPSGCRSCRTCSRATTRCARRTPASRNRRTVARSTPRSTEGFGTPSAGMCARSVIATKALTDFICGRQRFDQRREREVEEQVSGPRRGSRCRRSAPETAAD